MEVRQVSLNWRIEIEPALLDEPHDAELPPSRERGQPDRRRDQQRGRDEPSDEAEDDQRDRAQADVEPQRARAGALRLEVEQLAALVTQVAERDEQEPEQSERWFDDTWTGAENHPEPAERDKPSGIDTALIAVSNTQEFHMRLDDVLPRLGSIGRVWVLYPTDALPLPILRTGVDEYGWTTTDPTALDETWSAVQLTQS